MYCKVKVSSHRATYSVDCRVGVDVGIKFVFAETSNTHRCENFLTKRDGVLSCFLACS